MPQLPTLRIVDQARLQHQPHGFEHVAGIFLERQKLEQELGQLAPDFRFGNPPVVEHDARVGGIGHGPPGAPGKIFGQTRCMRHRYNSLALAQQQQLLQIGVASLPHSGPAFEIDRVAARGPGDMRRQHGLDPAQICRVVAVRAEIDPGFALIGERENGHPGLVDAQRLRFLRQHNVESQLVLGTEFLVCRHFQSFSWMRAPKGTACLPLTSHTVG